MPRICGPYLEHDQALVASPLFPTRNFPKRQGIDHIEHTMNLSMAENDVQWLSLDLNAFFASCGTVNLFDRGQQGSRDWAR